MAVSTDRTSECQEQTVSTAGPRLSLGCSQYLLFSAQQMSEHPQSPGPWDHTILTKWHPSVSRARARVCVGG